MTAEEIVEHAVAEVLDLGYLYQEGSRLPFYHRISARQQELFALASEWSPEFAGWSMLGQVASGVADLSSVLADDHPDLPGAERVTKIEITDIGSSSYVVGQEVHLVRAQDGAYTAVAPRATLRSGWLEQVGTDLTGVAQVRVYYIRRPRPVEEADDEPEIRPPHTELLILDLARFMIGREKTDDPNASGFTLGQITAREKVALASWEAHVRGFSRHQATYDL